MKHGGTRSDQGIAPYGVGGKLRRTAESRPYKTHRAGLPNPDPFPWPPAKLRFSIPAQRDGGGPSLRAGDEKWTFSAASSLKIASRDRIMS